MNKAPVPRPLEQGCLQATLELLLSPQPEGWDVRLIALPQGQKVVDAEGPDGLKICLHLNQQGQVFLGSWCQGERRGILQSHDNLLAARFLEPETPGPGTSLLQPAPSIPDPGRCPHCKHWLAPDSNFCGECGHRLKAECPFCHQPVEWSWRFCGRCGGSIGGDPKLEAQ